MSAALPKTIGKYPVQRRLGAGATSTVYLAEDPFFGRQVAIKVIAPEVLQHPELGRHYQKLFLTEAGLAGKLKHPHITAIYDAAVEGDCHYIVMEYVPGGTLERHCGANRLLPFTDVVEIAFKCSRALDYAHRQGVIHRDIKPANIMLGRESDIKITDFGIALAARAAHTQVSGVLGSPAYMSPEQVSDRPLTHQTDIYSLGVAMYQLLTGRLPFTAENQFSLLHKIVNDAAPPVQRVRPEVPAALAEVMARAMEKDTARRYQGWNEFSLDLTRAFAHLEQPQDKVGDTRKFETVRALRFFEDFTDVELWELLHLSAWKRFAPGRTLIEEGKLGQSFYVLAAGNVHVVKGKKRLAMLTPGDCFGEMAFIKRTRTQRQASVVADSEVTVLKIKASALLDASQNLQLKFNRRFLDILVDRLAHTTDLLPQ